VSVDLPDCRESVELDATASAAGKSLQRTPLIIIDAKPDSQFLPSHLAAQGFYLLRARTDLREISGILSK